jgi:hypothetical protein
MSKAEETTMSDSNQESAVHKPAEAQPAQRAASAVPLFDSSKAVCNYSNFCRVTGTPEELLIDLGLNENPTINPSEPIIGTQRVVLNYFTAKRLFHALQITLQRHEAAFGVIEVDIQKRLVPRARG